MDPSIERLRASDGTDNASIATVQSLRAPGASTISVDTTLGINSSFYGSMGTPHTFIDPVTGEEITVISEATAVDFAGHIDGSDLEIDEIAPGMTDLGSQAGDIIIIKPTTQSQDNLADVLSESLEDDGTMKSAAVLAALGSEDLSGYLPLGDVPDTVTPNGNRSYNLVFNGEDHTDILSPGMRLRLQRTVAAPTQCASLNGTNQYFSKSSPAGMSFTDDFVVSAWIKVSSYADCTIASRYNGTSGWRLGLESTGQLTLWGYNGGAANYSIVRAYQSVPLNKWVHVTAQLDMSTFTATTTTSYCMIDGVDVPSLVARGGTNPTALAQPASDLNIGSANGGSNYFPGKIAQVAIYNAKVTQATILASMNQGLSGSETSLISAYSLSNSVSDLNANANNLTAQGSVVTTNADSPFGGQANGAISSTLDYGIVQKVSFSTNTTVVAQVPEGNTIPSSGGVAAVVYSSDKAPYGIPLQSEKYRVEALYFVLTAYAIGAINAWVVASNNKLTIPAGSWTRGWTGPTELDSSVSGTRQGDFLLADSTPINAFRNYALSAFQIHFGSTFGIATPYKQAPYSVAAATVNTMYADIHSASGSESYQIRGDVSQFLIFADNAYV